MAEDKEIISRLLDALEMFSIENVMLMTMLRTYAQHFKLGNWEQDLENLKIEKGPDVRQLFGELRHAVARQRDLETAIQQFLKDTSPKGPVH
jgi:hypothetical protein